METLWQDIRYAVRMLIKNPGFSAIAMLSLALGIGANTTIFTVVNAILLHPLPVKDISRLVELDTVDTKTLVTAGQCDEAGHVVSELPGLRQAEPGFFRAQRDHRPAPLTWSGSEEPKQVLGQMVTANYFEVLGLTPVAGTFLLAGRRHQAGRQQRRGAELQLVGEQIRVGSRTSLGRS